MRARSSESNCLGNPNVESYSRSLELWTATCGSRFIHHSRRRLFRRHRGAWSQAHLPPPLSRLTAFAIVADSVGRVWLSFVDHVVLVAGDSTRVYSKSDGITVGRITALTLSGPRLWIGGAVGSR